ncbi:MAG: HEAT repeat domain-containing protein [Planctomycetes bacterium]|nr:HEAT repeat domain-containing protein [Planctomycetota bacterium]
MARSFIHSLLAAAVAAVVGGAVMAQEPLKEAVQLLRFGKQDEAKAKLREILTADPSNADALAMYQSVEQDEYLMLLSEKDDEIRKIAMTILERAKVERRERSRDDAAIRDLVGQALSPDSEFAARRTALNALVAKHGEFAVPALLESLGNADDSPRQILAIYALSELHGAAVLPLIEALKSSKELVVQNAAAALAQIGDDRAIPAMAHLAGDARVGIASIAQRFLAKKGVAKPAGGAAELLVRQARNYLKGIVPPGGHSDVVWHLVDEKLVAMDVAPVLYPAELAKSCAADAVAIAPQSVEAATALAAANLAQANLISKSGDESLKALEPVVADLHIAALATGLPALRAALDLGIQDGMAPVALGSIAALASAESSDTVGQSSLVKALDSTDKRVQYAAAAALVQATGGVNLPAQDKVVAVLAEAVAEEHVRTIHVIDPSQDTRVAVVAASSVRGNAVARDASAVSGLGALLKSPQVDVVVLNEVLPDAMPEVVIGNLKKDSRFANTKVVVIARDVEAAKTRFGDSIHGAVQAPLGGEALIAEVNRVLDGVASAGGERAEAFAKAASESLLALAAKKAKIDSAVDSLAKQLNRGDAVAVPAARALGHSGTAAQFDALLAALKGGSAEVKKAAAEALGGIMARGAACTPEVFEGLLGAVAADAEVGLRTAAAVALGKAKLEPAKAAELHHKLMKVAAAGGEAPKAEG